MVPDFDAFHVLTADVQNAVHLRIEEGGGLVVGDGLHLPLVQAEGGLQQGLAVAGGAGAENFSLRRQLLLQLTHGPDGGLDGRALIACVEGPQELPLLADQSQLGGGGPGVDAQVAISPVALQRGGLYPGPAVAGLEGAIFLLTLEEGRQPLQLKGHLHPLLQLGDESVQGAGLRLTGFQGSAHGGEEVGIFRVHHVFRCEMQGADEGLLQLRQEVEGAAQKGHAAPDGLAAGQAGNGLVHHGLEDGGGQVRQGGPFIDEGLNIRLGKDAAPGGNGVNFPVAGGLPVQTCGVSLQQGGHLVDEGAGAAGTHAIHPLLQAAPEIDDFGVFAPQLNGHVGLGRHPLQTGSHGHHLLDEANVHGLAQIDGAGAGDPHPQAAGAQLLPGFPQKLGQGFLGMGPVAAVLPEKNLPVCI